MNTLKIKDTKESDLIFNIMIVLIGFAFFNLRGYGYYVLLAAYGLFFVWTMFANVKIKLNEELAVLTVTFLLYIVIYAANYKFSLYSFVTNSFLLPVLSYVVGYHIILDANKPYINEKAVRTVLIVIVFALFLHGAISVLSTSADNLDNRRVNDIILGNNAMAATNNAGYINIMASFLFYGIFVQKGILKKIAVCVCAVISAWCGLLTGTRTPVIMFAAMFFISLICKIILDSNNRKMNVKILCITFAIIAIGLILYNANVFNIQDEYEQTSMYKRLNDESGSADVSNNARKNLYGQVLESIFENPMGTYMIKIGYAHNFWLDIGRLGGIIPFALIIIFSIMSLINFIQFFLRINSSMTTKYLIFAVYLTIFMNFFSEPIMEGLPFLCWLYTFISGMLKSFLDNFSNDKKLNTQ